MAISIPLSFLVNSYMTMNQINPSNSISFIKFLPFLFLSIVIAYGALHSKRLASNNQTKKAARLVVILIVLILVAMIVIPVFFNFGIPIYL
jgi:hypothetical protein